MGRTSSGKRDQLITALFDAHFRSLAALAYLMLGDAPAAEEVAMEAFTQFCARPRTRARIEHPFPYLRRMVLNLAAQRIRRLQIERRVNETVARWPTGSGSESSAVDLRLDVASAVRSLPARQRACVVLRYLEELPEAEIAETLGCSVGTVKSQLHKARAKLAAILGDEARVTGDA